MKNAELLFLYEKIYIVLLNVKFFSKLMFWVKNLP